MSSLVISYHPNDDCFCGVFYFVDIICCCCLKTGVLWTKNLMGFQFLIQVLYLDDFSGEQMLWLSWQEKKNTSITIQQITMISHKSVSIKSNFTCYKAYSGDGHENGKTYKLLYILY